MPNIITMYKLSIGKRKEDNPFRIREKVVIIQCRNDKQCMIQAAEKKCLEVHGIEAMKTFEKGH
jgi:hypothetical protein